MRYWYLKNDEALTNLVTVGMKDWKMYIIAILEEDFSGCHGGMGKMRSPKEFWSFLHLAARCMLFVNHGMDYRRKSKCEK